jgi:hypothetical protein
MIVVMMCKRLRVDAFDASETNERSDKTVNYTKVEHIALVKA